MSTLRARQETHTLEARHETEDPRARLASAWILCDVIAPERKEPAAPRRPVNVALVLDRSGSMAGEPLALALQGATLAIDALREGDRFGVVTYDDRVDVVVPSVAATAEAKGFARDRLRGVRDGGATDLHAGWLQGCEEVARGMTSEAESRCLLLTDGLANRGVTDRGEIARHAAELLRRGIVTSTFGLGDGFDEVLLQQLAEAGGGNAYWVREPGQIGPAMEAEVGDSLEVVARGVELVVEGPGVDEVLVPGVGRLARGSDGRFRHRLGNLSAGQLRSETLHVRLRRRLPGRPSAVSVRLEDGEGALPREERELLFTFQPKEVAAAAPLDSDVVVATRSAFAHSLVLEALRFDKPLEPRIRVATIEREAARLAVLAERVPALAPVVAELREAAERLSDEAFYMDSRRVKGAAYVAGYSLKGRDAAGRARYSSGVARLDVTIHGDGTCLESLAVDLSTRFGHAVRGLINARVLSGEPLPPTGPPSAEMTRAEQRRLLQPLVGPRQCTRSNLLVTPRPLEGNRFSTWHPDLDAAVVSTAGTGTDSRAPLGAFLAYEVVLHGLRPCWPEWVPETLMHEGTRGCLFDFCQVRSDLDVKLHSASLCHVCRERLRRARVDTGLVDALLSVVSDLAAAGAKKVN